MAGVGYAYAIGSYDVTVSQYTAFLNAVATGTDTYGLYNASMASDQNIAGIQQSGAPGSFTYSVIGASGSDPITYVSWLDAARFCNWLQNGQPATGIENATTTEDGAYTLNGDLDLSGTTGLETRNAGAQWWIPSEDEWYKAAYYDPTIGGTGGYWQFATQNNNIPGNIIGTGTDECNYYTGAGFCVTQASSYSASQFYLTPVGSFPGTTNYYGTFDQMGDVNEWNEGVILSTNRGYRGGSWIDASSVNISSSNRNFGSPTTETNYVGFRVATLPLGPSITSSLTDTGTADFPFSYQIMASNNPDSYSAGGLPTGLIVSSSTGLISGTPTVTGTFAATISAMNMGGTDTETFNLTIVGPPAPMITSTLNVTGSYGAAFSYQIMATNYPTGYSAMGLPAGLTLDPSAGLISGTPTVAGTISATISAFNLGGTDTETLSIYIIPPAPPMITSTLSVMGQEGVAFNYEIEATNNPTSYSSSVLPGGLTLDPSAGVISGTPTVNGTFGPFISAINAGGTDTEILVMDILPPPPGFGSNLAVTATNGVPFSYQVQASFNPSSYGATGLPPGLSIDTSNGQITGTPTMGGVYAVGLSAVNIGGTGTGTLTITVNTNVPALKGSYAGLGNVSGTNVALFTMTVNAKGAFTGKVTLAKGSKSIKGTFDQYGNYLQGAIGILLTTNATTPPVITGTVTNVVEGIPTNYVVQATPLGTFKTATLPVGLAGNYTAVIPAISNTDTTLPDAPGYGTLTVSKTGAIHLAGKLGDGTTLSVHAQLHADGKTWTLFESIYGGKTPGSVAGNMTFESLADSNCDGEIDWIKQPATKGIYLAGFGIPVDLYAATYASPPITSGTGITFAGDDLSEPFADSLSISGKKVTVSGANDVKVTLTTSTGLFSGSFLDPATNKKTSFSGAIYQKPQPTGFGLFIGVDQSGSVEIDP